MFDISNLELDPGQVGSKRTKFFAISRQWLQQQILLKPVLDGKFLFYFNHSWVYFTFSTLDLKILQFIWVIFIHLKSTTPALRQTDCRGDRRYFCPFRKHNDYSKRMLKFVTWYFHMSSSAWIYAACVSIHKSWVIRHWSEHRKVLLCFQNCFKSNDRFTRACKPLSQLWLFLVPCHLTECAISIQYKYLRSGAH